MSRSDCGETNRKRITQRKHEFVEVRSAWRGSSKLKQSAPIDEAEVQDNVTRQVPVKKLRYAMQVSRSLSKFKVACHPSQPHVGNTRTQCWEDELGLCSLLDHVGTYRSLNLREFEPERWVLAVEAMVAIGPLAT